MVSKVYSRTIQGMDEKYISTAKMGVKLDYSTSDLGDFAISEHSVVYVELYL